MNLFTKEDSGRFSRSSLSHPFFKSHHLYGILGVRKLEAYFFFFFWLCWVFVAVREFLIVVASLAAEHGL